MDSGVTPAPSREPSAHYEQLRALLEQHGVDMRYLANHEMLKALDAFAAAAIERAVDAALSSARERVLEKSRGEIADARGLRLAVAIIDDALALNAASRSAREGAPDA